MAREHDVYIDTNRRVLSGEERVASIDETGQIWIPSTWLAEKSIGYISQDGIYLNDGFGYKRIARITSHGNIYATSDEGLLSYGSHLGSIDEDGVIRDPNGVRVGEITGGSPIRKTANSDALHKVKPPTGNSIGMVIGGAAVLMLLCAIMFIIAWNSSMSVFENPVSMLSAGLFVLCALFVAVSQLMKPPKDLTLLGILRKSYSYYLIPCAIYAVFLFLFDHSFASWVENYGGVLTLLYTIISWCIILPLFLCCVGVPILIVQSLVVYCMMKVGKRGHLD